MLTITPVDPSLVKRATGMTIAGKFMEQQNGDASEQVVDSTAKPPPARPEAFGRGEHSAPNQDETKNDESSSDDGQKTETKKPDHDAKGEKRKKGDDPEAQKKPFWKRPVLFSVMIIVALALVITGVTLYLVDRHYESTDDAFIDGRIVHIAPRVAGKVKSLNVDDNQWVEADTVLIEIDPADFIARRDESLASVQNAEAKVAQAQADLAVSQASAAQSRADVDVAKANATNAQRDFDRYQSLPAAARSRQQIDNSTAMQTSTGATVVAMEKKAESMQAQVDANKTAIHAAEAEVSSAQAQLEQANLNLSYTKVVSGHAGWVTRRTVERGNYVQVGQEILDVVPKDIWVTANFKETQLAEMKPGQLVTISVDSYPDRDFRGKVASVQSGTGAVFTLLPPENATGNYVKVVQRVPVKILFDSDPQSDPDHKLSPGMSVEPRVRVLP